MPKPAFTFDLESGGGWTEVERARQAVRSHVAAGGGDRDLQDALSVAAAELAENALKYGPRTGAVRIEIEIHDEAPPRVRVSQDATEPAPSSALAARLAWISRHATTQGAYEAAIGGDRSGPSGLGLVRITHEAGCDVHVEQSADSLIVVATKRR